MLYKATDLDGYKLGAVDGNIGRVHDFYFDDRFWTVRYLVDNTGSWLDERAVLISPQCLTGVETGNEIVRTELTVKQVEDSPPIAADEPVSSQNQQSLYSYYGWSPYWYGTYAWGMYAYPMAQPRVPVDIPNDVREKKHWDPHLRSAGEVKGYHLHALDGDIGHVQDFLIDSSVWTIRYLVVKTTDWWPGGEVLMSPEWIEKIDWADREVFVNVHRETVKKAPEYNRHTEVTREYEETLHRYYQREGYWTRDHSHVS